MCKITVCLSLCCMKLSTHDLPLLYSYTSYYEGLLKVNTQLLYTKEQEIKLVRDQLQQVDNNVDVEVQCRLADKNHELIMGNGFNAKLVVNRKIINSFLLVYMVKHYSINKLMLDVLFLEKMPKLVF